jgi:succinate dehydrogenase / fumarate reductase flavoprotein subunit
MNDLVGIIRRAEEMEQALSRLADLRGRIAKVTVEGHRQFNPGWHLALDLRNMLTVSECIAKAALLREESRGGHTRDDFPGMNPEWRKLLLVCSSAADGGVSVVKKDQLPMRNDLLELFELNELTKYLTEEELPA